VEILELYPKVNKLIHACEGKKIFRDVNLGNRIVIEQGFVDITTTSL
jgi:hypothetical protein